MAYLEEIPISKNLISHYLVENDKIVDILDSSLLSDNEDGEYDSSDLIGDCVFPFIYIPDEQDEVKTYICFDIYVPKVQDNLYKTIQLVVNVFSHKKKQSFNGDTRVDMLVTEIDKIFNGNENFGIDGLELVSVLPYSVHNKYYGKQMIYNVLQFNQKDCKYKEFEKNRKLHSINGS